jgi:hypothetical protein
MDNFDAEDGGGLVDAFEKGKNIPSAVSQKDSLSKILQNPKLACICGQHPERALYLKTRRIPSALADSIPKGLCN